MHRNVPNVARSSAIPFVPRPLPHPLDRPSPHLPNHRAWAPCGLRPDQAAHLGAANERPLLRERLRQDVTAHLPVQLERPECWKSLEPPPVRAEGRGT